MRIDHSKFVQDGALKMRAAKKNAGRELKISNARGKEVSRLGKGTASNIMDKIENSQKPRKLAT